MDNKNFTNYIYYYEKLSSPKHLKYIRDILANNETEDKKLKTILSRKNLKSRSLKSNLNKYYTKDTFKKILPFYKDCIDIKVELADMEYVFFNSGLGNESVFETSLNIHEIYGCPYLPASSIKGSFRAFINKHCKEIFGDKSSIIDYLFGSEDKKGCLVFFDTLPNNNDYEITEHILTNKYPIYYDEQKFLNTDKTRIISFPCVKNIRFNFIVCFDQRYTNKDLDNDFSKILNENNTLINDQLKINFKPTIEDFMKKSFQKHLEFGIGAKTSVGFGSFKQSTK